MFHYIMNLWTEFNSVCLTTNALGILTTVVSFFLQQLQLWPWPVCPALHQPALVAAPPPLTSPHHRFVFIIYVFLRGWLSSPDLIGFLCAIIDFSSLLTIYYFLYLFTCCFVFPRLCSSLLLRFSICVPKLWHPQPRRPLVFSWRTRPEAAAAARTPPPVTQMTLS